MHCLFNIRRNSVLFPILRYYSSCNIKIQRQNELFDNEKNRQKNDIGRIEKIEVQYDGLSETRKFIMNKGISTPHNVAQHISEWLSRESALALVNDETAWDMHRPFEDSCTLKFLRFNDDDPFLVNKAFWKFCSFLLGATVSNAFIEETTVELYSFPSPQITSGSFVYDVYLSLLNWEPSPNELRILSADMVKLASQELPLERLQVNEDIAREIFKENRFKLEQIPSIAAGFGGQVILYRMGSHIDISKGPLIGNSSQIGRCSVTGVHRMQSDNEDLQLYRFQGIALPRGIMLNHFAFKILEDRAKKLNRTSFVEHKIGDVA